MADALASGASVRKDVGVQVPPRAPLTEMSQIFVVENLDEFHNRMVPPAEDKGLGSSFALKIYWLPKGRIMGICST